MWVSAISQQENQLRSALLDIQILKAEILRLREELNLTKVENQKLNDKLAKNSGNSSKPPSTDWINKPAPKSQREKSGLKVGGQFGHEGNCLDFTEEPDAISLHDPEECDRCGSVLHGDWIRYERRQVIDLVDNKVSLQ